jgi:hypothetical protein
MLNLRFHTNSTAHNPSRPQNLLGSGCNIREKTIISASKYYIYIGKVYRQKVPIHTVLMRLLSSMTLHQGQFSPHTHTHTHTHSLPTGCVMQSIYVDNYTCLGAGLPRLTEPKSLVWSDIFLQSAIRFVIKLLLKVITPQSS